ncbi:hypothetical protein W97_08194 [Coniosporium apollinis CBS 100218]|uniref:Uncharacterized protein n=1 Tax=Coniosporium apollinis (strain CBS 100218) TaxID=1168221 RepID=R7Z4R7_CONA1|nr:uncharacterized protein W97_08194 [Coniosporium apollinis CBS 100218]EON68936.1 hypothetical protein W97_08194 [Coniosporium apollinis CBS 100218]
MVYMDLRCRSFAIQKYHAFRNGSYPVEANIPHSQLHRFTEELPQDPWETIISGLEALGGPLDQEDHPNTSVKEVHLMDLAEPSEAASNANTRTDASSKPRQVGGPTFTPYDMARINQIAQSLAQEASKETMDKIRAGFQLIEPAQRQKMERQGQDLVKLYFRRPAVMALQREREMQRQLQRQMQEQSPMQGQGQMALGQPFKGAVCSTDKLLKDLSVIWHKV